MSKDADGIAYLTTGPTFSQFYLGCDSEMITSFYPTCIVLTYDGKPGIVELYIPKYIIDEFSNLKDVHVEENKIFDKNIPFQKLDNDRYATVRLDIPSGHTLVKIFGWKGEPAVSNFHYKIIIWSYGLFFPLFFVGFILFASFERLSGYMKRVSGSKTRINFSPYKQPGDR